MSVATAIDGNRIWTRDGLVWAVWRLHGLSDGLGTPDERSLVRLHHQALVQALRGESLLMSLCRPVPPDDTAGRMLEGVERPSLEWRREVDLTREALRARPVQERTFWLAVPLSTGTVVDRSRRLLEATLDELRRALALPRSLPAAEDRRHTTLVADRIERAIPSVFEPRRASPDELEWMSEQACVRGVATGAVPRLAVPQPGDDSMPPRSAAGLAAAWLDEGGMTDRPRAGAVNPMAHRYLKVQSARADAPSYQVLLALTGGPKGGWRVPGIEWISRVDESTTPIDWAVRLTVAAGAEVRRRNRSAEVSLRDQLVQQDASSDELRLGHGAQLGEVAETLQAYAASLARSESEVEVQATTVFAIGGADAAEAQAAARHVRDWYGLSEFRLDLPLGGQEQLWRSMQPGEPTGRLVRELAQLTTGREFASGVPLVSTALGDDRGFRFAEHLGSGRRPSVLLDLAGTIQHDRSASIGIVAELGAGKSYALKRIAGDSLDRGARVIIIDRTEAREYERFAGSLVPDATAVVDLVNPSCSLDPLRLFGPQTGSRHVLSLFSSLLGVRPRDDLGLELARLLDPARVAGRGISSLAELRTHLRGRDGGAVADRLHSLVELIAGMDVGRVLFDPELPPLDLAARAIIPLTAGLDLPTGQELDRAHLFEELPMEKLVGRAMYALVTGIAKQIAFTSRELVLFCADECHHITTSPEGAGYVLDFLRDGRKHNALAVLASHDPHDFGDVRARGLIPIRLVMRHTDRGLAQRALEWLDQGLAGDERLLATIREDLSPAGPDGVVHVDRRGEGVLRDARQRIGKVRVLPPLRAERRAALSSTPVREPLTAVAARERSRR